MVSFVKIIGLAYRCGAHALVNLSEALLDAVKPSGYAIHYFCQPVEICSNGCGFCAQIAQSFRNSDNRSDAFADTP